MREWRFSFLTESGKAAWFPGEPFLAANRQLYKSELVNLIVDRQSALVVADQIEEQGLAMEANAIRDFLAAEGPIAVLCDPNPPSQPST